MLLRDEESPAPLGDVDANGRRSSRATRWRGDKGPGGTAGLLPARPRGMRCRVLCTPGYVQWVQSSQCTLWGCAPLCTLVLRTLCTHTRGHVKRPKCPGRWPCQVWPRLGTRWPQSLPAGSESPGVPGPAPRVRAERHGWGTDPSGVRVPARPSPPARWGAGVPCGNWAGGSPPHR